MSIYLNEALQSLQAYTPGEQPQDRRYIKLNTNESPFPPSAGVIAAVNAQEAQDLRLYCDPTCGKLRAAMANLYGVSAENVFLSNGSDDILNFAFMAYGHSGAAYPDITYGFYDVFAELHRVKAKKIPLNEDFTVDVEAFKGQNCLVVIANPNAPTGIALPLNEIEEIVRENPQGVVVIDEAYVDFGAQSAVKLTHRYPNLLVCGTFSKSRSMAGARLGFAIGNSALIADLEKIKYSTNPYNVNRLTQAAGLMAVLENDYYVSNCQRIMENRAYTTAQLQALGFEVLPSEANFLFARSSEIGGEDLYLRLKEKGILVRHFTARRIKEFNRITIGSKKEMEIFVSAVKEILEEVRG